MESRMTFSFLSGSSVATMTRSIAAAPPDRCAGATALSATTRPFWCQSSRSTRSGSGTDLARPSGMRAFLRLVGPIIALALVAVGCGTFVTATSLNPPPRRLVPRAAGSVDLFSSTPPSRPHVDAALLEAEQNDGQSTAVMVQKLRDRAGDMGCDAIFIGNPGEERHYGARTLTATCIVYTDGTNPPPAPPVVDYASGISPPPAPPSGSPRMCQDRADFERSRNCVMPR